MKKKLLDLWFGQIINRIWQWKRRRAYMRARQSYNNSCLRLCHYCDEPLSLETFTVDHVTPQALGGSDAISNLVACCKYCNKIKGAKPVTEFMLSYMRHRASLRRSGRREKVEV